MKTPGKIGRKKSGQEDASRISRTTSFIDDTGGWIEGQTQFVTVGFGSEAVRALGAGKRA
jgi:hypothetical protein